MSILIAYLIIGLTFAISYVIAHEPHCDDSLHMYIVVFIVFTMLWPRVLVWAFKNRNNFKVF